MSEETAKAAPRPWLERPAVKLMLRHRVLILTAFTLALFLAGANRFFYFRGGDNAVYWLLARYLAQGRAYAELYAYPPEPSTKVPFFFPLMLAGLIRLFGEKILPVKALLAGCAALAVGAGYRMWDERGGKRIALLSAALAATVPYTLDYSVRILSEIPFAAGVSLTLLGAERARRQDSIKNPALVLTLLALTAAYFTRSAGITLLPAVAGAFLVRAPVRERFRANLAPAAALSLPFLAAATAWFLRDYFLTQHPPEYIGEFFIRNPSEYHSPQLGLMGILERTWHNTVYYLTELGRTLGPWAAAGGKAYTLGWGCILTLFILGGWSQAVRRHRGAPELFLPAYTGLILVWTAASKRFLIPLYPGLLYYFLQGVAGLVEGLGSRSAPRSAFAWGRGTLTALALVMLGSNLAADFGFLWKMNALRRAKGFEISPGFELIATDWPRKRFLILTLYLRYSAEPEAIIYSRKSSLVALVSDRRVVLHPLPPDAEGVIAGLEKNQVNYILVDEVDDDVRDTLAPALKAYPDRFQLVYQLPGSQSRIYKFLPASRT